MNKQNIRTCKNCRYYNAFYVKCAYSFDKHKAELETLNCYLNGMTQSEAALALGITIFGVKYRKLRIRQKYQMYIGT